MAKAAVSASGTATKKGWIKWVVIVLIILAVLWYLNSAGYINLPFL
ncbi:hypothetical protein KY338_02105 [Candidatus Woesearchaeota archaeon]|nr:hypothetical protein [Candidatus Woesearchaeota archaeon]MBW3006085.1 hypothetical protein [Candidatus Woesearchaeota archaeon]